MAIAEQKMTVKDFEMYISKYPDRLVELVDGKVVEKIPTARHGVIAVNISTEIRIYLKSHPIGWVGSEVRHRNPEDNYNDRIPDIAVNCSAEIVEQGAVPVMPDLAIEIKSPDDSVRGMREKADYYLQNGSQLVWLVYPDKQLVEVYRKNGEIDILALEDILSGEDVLPDFELPVHDIFV